MPKTLVNPTAEEGLRALQGRTNVTSWDVVSEVHDRTPGYVYRWVNKNEMRVDHMKAMGWEVVNMTNDSARAGTWNDGAGAWKSGDRILMRLTEYLYYSRKDEKAKRMSRLRGESEDAFRSEAAALKVKTFSETEES